MNTMNVLITTFIVITHLFFCFFCTPQKKAFQEDRAAWLKNQFLNMTPFTDRRCSSSDGQSALSISKSKVAPLVLVNAVFPKS